MKYCWGGCRDEPTTETRTREERGEMRGGMEGETQGVKNIKNNPILYDTGQSLCDLG